MLGTKLGIAFFAVPAIVSTESGAATSVALAVPPEGFWADHRVTVGLRPRWVEWLGADAFNGASAFRTIDNTLPIERQHLRMLAAGTVGVARTSTGAAVGIALFTH